MSSSEVNFLLHVQDGYSLRNTLGIAKAETTNLTIIFRPNSVNISYNNKSCACHIIKLKPTQFPIYNYNFVDEDGNVMDKYELTVDATELYSTTKGTGKNDALRIYWLKSENNRICVQILKATNRGMGNASAAYVNIIQNPGQDIVEYVVDKSVINENVAPNVSIAAKSFGDTCNNITALKCVAMEIIGSKKMVTFNGIGTNNSIQTTSEYKSQVNAVSESLNSPSGNIDSYLSNLIMPTEVSNNNINFTLLPADQIVTVRIPASTAKSMSKIYNVSANKTNTLDFYFVRGKPIHIVTQISTYGTYTIVIRNTNTQ